MSKPSQLLLFLLLIYEIWLHSQARICSLIDALSSHISSHWFQLELGSRVWIVCLRIPKHRTARKKNHEKPLKEIKALCEVRILCRSMSFADLNAVGKASSSRLPPSFKDARFTRNSSQRSPERKSMSCPSSFNYATCSMLDALFDTLCM